MALLTGLPRHDITKGVLHNLANRHRWYVARVDYCPGVKGHKLGIHGYNDKQKAKGVILAYVKTFSWSLSIVSQMTIASRVGDFNEWLPDASVYETQVFADSIFCEYLNPPLTPIVTSDMMI